MSENSDQEKTEEPTSKRLEDAHKKGQIARSRELNTFVMLITSAALLLMLGEQMGNSLLAMMRGQFQLSREIIFDPVSPLIYLKQLMIDGVMLIAPFIAVLVVAAIVAPLALGGWVFSWEALTPKFEKLDPVKGITRLFALRGLIELIKALLKFLFGKRGLTLRYEWYFVFVVSVCDHACIKGTLFLVSAGLQCRKYKLRRRFRAFERCKIFPY